MDAPDYYKLRLEHTIQHIQQATRLIYFVSGAIIAMLYFVVEKLAGSESHRAFGIALLLLLGLVNALHALLIRVQSDWYKAIDKELAQSIGAKQVTRGRVWLGSAGLWADVHWVVAAAAFIAGGYLWWSGAQL